MGFTIREEKQLLDPEYRLDAIKYVQSAENINRKRDQLVRHEFLRDMIRPHIIEHLKREMDFETVAEMSSRVADINLYKKVINKKARVYKNEPVRIAAKKRDQKKLDLGFREMKLNTTMKRDNKYVEAHNNAVIYVRPYKDYKTGQWDLELRVIAPHAYDVIVDEQNKETARVYILSDMKVSNDFRFSYILNPNSDGRDEERLMKARQSLVSVPNMIDKDAEYIWWSDSYHFKTNGVGEMIEKTFGENKTDPTNPLGELPFVDFHKQQDGEYYAFGGDDLVNGTVLVNTVLTDINFIQKIHGMGIFYFFGKDVPKTFKLGPNRGITHNVEDNDPTPQIGFAEAAPKLKEMGENLEQYVAFLLSTNDLSPKDISGSLNAANGVMSGIQKIIENAEPMNAIEDEHAHYAEQEPKVVDKFYKWIEVFKARDPNLLVERLRVLPIPSSTKYAMRLEQNKPYLTEMEKLDVIERRRDIGLDTPIDSIKLDNTNMTDEEAMERLATIKQAQSELREELINGQESNDDDTTEPEESSTGSES